MSRDALLVSIANSLSLFQHGHTFDTFSVVGLECHVLSALRSEECILCLDNFESPWDQLSPSRKAVEMLLADKRAEKLIDAVDCLPLAVTILGSLAEVSTAETLWDRWQKESVAFVGKEKGDMFVGLEFSIALSLEGGRMAADVSSKRLLGILSMLPDGMPAFPLPEFQRLFSDIPHISRSLDTLLKYSLAVRTPDKRVKANSLVRLYCESHDLASPEDRRTLRDYYVTLASHCRNYNDLGHCLFKGMTMEMKNMESVLCKSLTWTPLPEVTLVIEAIIAYTDFCIYISNFSDVVVTCAPEVQVLLDQALGDFLISLGSVSLYEGKLALAEVHFKRALVLHESAQDIIGQADDYSQLGDVLYRCHRMEEAKTCYQSALDLNVQSNNLDGQANALTHLAEIYKKLGKLEELREHYERSLTFHEEHHDQRSFADTLNDLGHVYLMMDNIKRAKESFEKALKLHKAVNDPVGQANDVSGLADVYQRLYTLSREGAAHKKVDGSARQR
jgi:tetratricopeptide (TPR) repeat protein